MFIVTVLNEVFLFGNSCLRDGEQVCQLLSSKHLGLVKMAIRWNQSVCNQMGSSWPLHAVCDNTPNSDKSAVPRSVANLL